MPRLTDFHVPRSSSGCWHREDTIAYGGHRDTGRRLSHEMHAATKCPRKLSICFVGCIFPRIPFEGSFTFFFFFLVCRNGHMILALVNLYVKCCPSHTLFTEHLLTSSYISCSYSVVLVYYRSMVEKKVYLLLWKVHIIHTVSYLSNTPYWWKSVLLKNIICQDGKNHCLQKTLCRDPGLHGGMNVSAYLLSFQKDY